MESLFRPNFGHALEFEMYYESYDAMHVIFALQRKKEKEREKQGRSLKAPRCLNVVPSSPLFPAPCWFFTLPRLCIYGGAANTVAMWQMTWIFLRMSGVGRALCSIVPYTA